MVARHGHGMTETKEEHKRRTAISWSHTVRQEINTGTRVKPNINNIDEV
jgi:hypothetical protein